MVRIHRRVGGREGMPFEALTPLTPLSQGERGEQEKTKKNSLLSFSLLSLWERRAGEVRASKGIPPNNSRSVRRWISLILLLFSYPAHAADLSLDVTAEHLSATFTGDRTTEASAVTLGIGFAPSDRLAVRIEVPAVRARSSQTLLSSLGPTPRVLQALAAGNNRALQRLQRQVPGEWQTGLGDVRIEIMGELAGGGARLFRLAAELDAKAPTADADRRLGTGRWDARIGLLGERRFWSATLFGG